MIGLFGAVSGSNAIIQLHDPTVTTDEGVAMETPFYDIVPIDMGPAGRTGRLRRVVQQVAIGAANTIKVTPIVNGSAQTLQAESFALVTTDGPEQPIEMCPDATGTRFQMRVEVTSYGGSCAFGEADLVVVPKRSSVRA